MDRRLTQETFSFARTTDGSVYSCRWKGVTVARKEIQAQDASNTTSARSSSGQNDQRVRKLAQQLVQEVHVLSKLKHPNIVLLYGMCVQGSCFSLVMEFVSGGSMGDLISRGKMALLSTRERINLLLQVASAMDYLHNKPTPVLHRDLKATNILVDIRSGSAMTAKVADFGLSRTTEFTGNFTRAGTVQCRCCATGCGVWG